MAHRGTTLARPAPKAPLPAGGAVARGRKRTRWRRFVRFCRRYREIIMIVLVILMSLAFLGYGFLHAIALESLHPSWFGNGF